MRTAHEVHKQVLKLGLELPDAPARKQITQQAQSLSEASAGAALYALAAACREAGIDPESALRRYTAGLQRSAK